MRPVTEPSRFCFHLVSAGTPFGGTFGLVDLGPEDLAATVGGEGSLKPNVDFFVTDTVLGRGVLTVRALAEGGEGFLKLKGDFLAGAAAAFFVPPAFSSGHLKLKRGADGASMVAFLVDVRF